MPTQIALWQIDCRQLSKQALERFASVLTVQEQAKEARFVQAPDRLRFRVGRGLVRILSSQMTGIPTEDLCWVQADQGKPHWGNAGLPFNLSHSGDWVFVCLGGAHPLGVDIQFQSLGIDIDKVAHYAMSPAEITVLDHLDAAERRQVFFDLWVLREAGLKATGRGIYDQSHKVSALPIPGMDRWAPAEGLQEPGLWLQRLSAPVGYSAALGAIGGALAPDPPKVFGAVELRAAIGF